MKQTTFDRPPCARVEPERPSRAAASDAGPVSRDPTSKRRQIIDGAAFVFNELGYDGASMSRIAEQANVSKGTLYNYFASKSDLFSAFVEKETSEMRAFILGTVEEDAMAGGGNVAASLAGIARRLIQSLLSPGAQTLHRIVLSEAGKFPHLAQIYYDAGYRRGIRETADWLRVRVAAGELRITDLDLAAEQFASLCRTRLWMKRCFNLSSGFTDAEIDAIVDANVAMFLNTYGPDRRP